MSTKIYLTTKISRITVYTVHVIEHGVFKITLKLYDGKLCTKHEHIMAFVVAMSYYDDPHEHVLTMVAAGSWLDSRKKKNEQTIYDDCENTQYIFNTSSK